MCDPVTLTVVAIAGTVLSAGAQVYSGMAANAQGKYEQKIANMNAKAERASVEDAKTRDAVAQQQHWRKVAAALGMQQAQAAALGLDTDFGSVGNLQDDTLMIGYEDSSTINSNFMKEVKGYDINAENYTMQGQAARARGHAAMIGGFMGAAGTLLSGASQVGKINANPGGAGAASFGSTGGYSNSSTSFGGASMTG